MSLRIATRSCSFTRPIAIPATGFLQRRTAVQQRERCRADGGHRGRAVRFQDIGHEAHGVREFLSARHHDLDRAFGQVAVTDLAAAGGAEAADLADGERREVVVQHEPLRVLRQQTVDDLLVQLRAERQRRETLRLTALEQGGTVRARKQADLDGDRTDVAQPAAVEPLAVREDHLAHGIVFEVVQDRLDRVGLRPDTSRPARQRPPSASWRSVRRALP